MSYLSFKDFTTNNNQFDLDPNKKIVVYIDMNNLMHSYLHYPDFNHNHQILSLLYNLKMEINPKHFFVIFDGVNNKESKLTIYPEYKKNRQTTPDLQKNKGTSTKIYFRFMSNFRNEFIYYSRNGS